MKALIETNFVTEEKIKIMFNEGRVHIFIVEDNEIYSMMLDYILSKDSVYKFTSFKSGEDCVRNLRQNPDVVILDYALPGMNG